MGLSLIADPPEPGDYQTDTSLSFHIIIVDPRRPITHVAGHKDRA